MENKKWRYNTHMKTITFTKDALVTGENALDYLGTLKCKKAVIITGGHSMKKERTLQHIWSLMGLNS